MQTARTGLRSVARRDCDDFQAGLGGLVGNHLLQLGEAPIVDTFRLSVLSNAVEVFEDDSLIVDFRVGDNLFADAMVGVGYEPPLSARDTFERALGALTAVGLKRLPGSFVASFLGAILLRRVKFLVRRYGHALDAEINAETARRLGDFGRWNCDRKTQVEASLAIDQFGRTRLAFAKLFAYLRRHLQLAGDATLRTDGQRSGVTVPAENHGPRVVSDRRMRFELVKLVRLARISAAHLCNRVDHVLSVERGFFPDRVIARVVNVIFAMQVLLKGQLGKSVARAVELFHRGFERLSRFGADNQFRLDRQVNAHSLGV